MFALRVFLIFRYRFDSDEPQHMHVAWGWAHGLVQYRDVFDNHMPLFHMLSAPLFAVTGDDVRVLFVARLFVLPLFFLSLLLTHTIAARIFDERTAWWAAALTAVCPPFFLGTLEYRTDDLWVVLWLMAIAVFVSDRTPAKKGALGGFLIGLAFAVSMKSTLFVISLALATVLTYLLTHKRAGLRAMRDTIRFSLAGVAAMVIVPGAIAIGFALAGAGNYFRYGVIDHNRFPYEHAWHVLWFIPLYFIGRALALRLANAEGEIPIVRRRLFVFLACALYFTVLSSFWPMLSLESYLPFYPLAVIFATPLVLRWADRLRESGHVRIPAIPAIAVATGVVVIVVTAAPWRNEANDAIELISEVLSVTSPSDPVMDMKGETLFRQRPYYLVLEAITNRKMRLGWLKDDVAEALVRTKTHVVASEDLPPKSRQFVKENYLPWGRVRVAGLRLPPVEAKKPIEIDVRVPGRYVVVGARGVLDATVDGQPRGRNGMLDLDAGRHLLWTNADDPQPLLVWYYARQAPDFEQRCAKLRGYAM